MYLNVWLRKALRKGHFDLLLIEQEMKIRPFLLQMLPNLWP